MTPSRMSLTPAIPSQGVPDSASSSRSSAARSTWARSAAGSPVGSTSQCAVTGNGSLPSRSRRRRSVDSALSPIAISTALVTPAARYASKARSMKPSRSSSEVMPSRYGSTSSMAAVSSRNPVARPCSSRTISPPTGSGVPSSMPSTRSAAVFTQVEWRSFASRKTGMSPMTASSIAAVGRETPSGSASKRQLTPSMRVAPGSARRAASSRSRICSSVSQSRSCTLLTACPNPERCAWASLTPGIENAPPRSTTAASAPAAARTSASSPTASTRSPRTAKADPRRSLVSPVKTTVLTYAVVVPGIGDPPRSRPRGV